MRARPSEAVLAATCHQGQHFMVPVMGVDRKHWLCTRCGHSRPFINPLPKQRRRPEAGGSGTAMVAGIIAPLTALAWVAHFFATAGVGSGVIVG